MVSPRLNGTVNLNAPAPSVVVTVPALGPPTTSTLAPSTGMCTRFQTKPLKVTAGAAGPASGPGGGTRDGAVGPQPRSVGVSTENRTAVRTLFVMRRSLRRITWR